MRPSSLSGRNAVRPYTRRRTFLRADQAPHGCSLWQSTSWSNHKRSKGSSWFDTRRHYANAGTRSEMQALLFAGTMYAGCHCTWPVSKIIPSEVIPWSAGGLILKKHLNTLFVTTQGTYLSKEGECAVISIDKVEKTRIPLHMLQGIICFGRISFSPYLFGYCAELGITITFLTEYGKFLCLMQGPARGNICYEGLSTV